MQSIQFDSLIKGYLEYLKDIKRLAHRTIVDVKCTLLKVMEKAEKIRPGNQLWELSLDDHMQWMEQQRQEGKSAQSINKQLSHIRGLIDYAWHNGRTDRNVLEGFYKKDADKKIMPDVLSIEEVTSLIKSCSQQTKQDRYNRLIILLLYGCGFRTHELCDLNVPDIDTERQEIFIRQGKGDVKRRVPVPIAVWTELLAYMTERGGKLGPLFKTQIKKKRIRSVIVSEILKHAVDKAGINRKVTPKMLRHTFATHLMDVGVNLGIISTLMGHRSPRETGVYLHALKNRKDSAIDKLSRNLKKEEEE